jgi:hypothetical protein
MGNKPDPMAAQRAVTPIVPRVTQTSCRSGPSRRRNRKGAERSRRRLLWDQRISIKPRARALSLGRLSAKSSSCHRAKSLRSLFALTLGQEGLEGCELHSQLLDCM